MHFLTDLDWELVAAARDAIRANYDALHNNHTVGAAVRCKSGNIYVGVNVYSIHGACAEQVAIGTAITQGERAFETIVAVRGKDGEEVIPPGGLYAGVRSASRHRPGHAENSGSGPDPLCLSRGGIEQAAV